MRKTLVRVTEGSGPSRAPASPRRMRQADEVKNMEFTIHKPTDVAEFEVTNMTLVRWIGRESFTGAVEASYALEHGAAQVPGKP